MKWLKRVDPAIAAALRREVQRQRGTLVLIASENYTSRAVLEAQGSVLTNKYAEGYPGRRYYGGCEHADEVEALAIERARRLFGAEHANVQPHSGTQANMAVYFSVLKPGDTIMGMDLAHGGHLSHGARVNFSGKLYTVVFYGVNRETGLIDYDEVARLAEQSRPRMLIAGFSAYARTLDFPRFRAIADSVGAYLVADMAHIAGLVAAGVLPSPVPSADFVTTTTHKTLRGPRGGMVLCRGDHATALDKALFPGIQGGPLMHVIAAKAVAFEEAGTEEFRVYQRQIVANAKALAHALSERGFQLVSGGTDNHLILVDLHAQGLTGKDVEATLGRVGIAVNKNAIPGDPYPPAIAGGIRLGTPVLTTRGMHEPEMVLVADLIARAVKGRQQSAVRREVRALCRQFPAPY